MKRRALGLGLRQGKSYRFYLYDERLSMTYGVRAYEIPATAGTAGPSSSQLAPSKKRVPIQQETAEIMDEEEIYLGLKLKDIGKVGPDGADLFFKGSLSKVAQLEEKRREAQEESREKDKENKEMAIVMMK
ncbi:unnamed protein product [Cuscuta campestris]|uniref:Uncharacterized protein n=1 Tax=Cuscuta campestris TaxID=132261 RepID=A0A484L836_9ASTE|nr:unnamed protein product [Cuscuta campestris]